MILSDYLGVKLGDILLEEENLELTDFGDNDSNISIKAQQQWHSSIVSLEKLLMTTIELEKNNPQSIQGLIISSPTPVIQDVKLISHLETVIFSSWGCSKMALMPSHSQTSFSKVSSFIDVSLGVNDTLNDEQFTLVLTDKFSFVMVKSMDKNNEGNFHFSFNPEIIKKIWFLLKARLILSKNYHKEYLEELFTRFYPTIPDYKIVTQFSRYLLQNISSQENLISENNKIPRQSSSISLKKTPLPPYPEFELLQALTHEIRTPLTTIKTLTKLLLKRAKSTPELVKHLESIEQECTEQINRMELIFRAAELESKSSQKSEVKLVPISLEQILNQSIPNWKKQAERRNIILDIIIPNKLPQIVSDPNMLTQILTGLMERFTRNLPSGEHFKVLILPAGNQLKLQFLSESNVNNEQVKCLGKLLLFQPNTGSLSLSHDVTKNIFHALGGKLIIKQKPDKGEILTIFLPLGNSFQISK
ncbi:sensor histidine kinase KdpD [Geminocystis sp. NIES-3709]|uniref:sensor histidine kinase n=1 Tax=Geminocystis sp. NIES-3709 TaxID=1617448 RepID=UPI0005FC4F3F|nr:HAMP domain-containing sensor histidine kinase [Geminocystis sp. NIES-3709]BAQ64886.1 histidine kinase A [Geminocystis sp. NIES-3709]